MRTLVLLSVAAVLFGAFTGPAAAEAPIRLEQPVASRPALQIRVVSPYDAGQALKAEGIARTSLGRSLKGEGSTAAIGFLCGMAPSTQTYGGAGALGFDTEGRFLGAQLKFGFR